jgi:hypothetical protein
MDVSPGQFVLDVPLLGTTSLSPNIGNFSHSDAVPYPPTITGMSLKLFVHLLVCILSRMRRMRRSVLITFIGK